MSCDVGHRRGSDPVLLWLWCRPVAVAPIGPLAWESPYTTGAALEKDKNFFYEVNFSDCLIILCFVFLQ